MPGVAARPPSGAYWGANELNSTLGTMDDPRRLAIWQPDVRASVIAWEALEPLGVTSPTTADGTVVLRVNGAPLMEIVRPGDAQLEAQAERVLDAQKARKRRQAEILTQVTPPFAFFSTLVPLHPDRTPRTIEWLIQALGLATACVLRLKHSLACPRPYTVNASIQPMILVPAHGSFPSGHATESACVATALLMLLSADGKGKDEEGQPTRHDDALRTVAHRIANNRVVAGLHYPMDSLVGATLGETLARYLVARASGATVTGWRFNGMHDELGAMQAGEKALGDALGDDVARSRLADAANVGKSEPLAWLWQQARAEWGR